MSPTDEALEPSEHEHEPEPEPQHEPEPETAAAAASHDGDLERIVEKISTEHAFDVRGYRRSTIYRRLRKRMGDVGCGSVEDYLVRLESDRHEYSLLIDTILINVTNLFRDPEAWAYLKEECLAPMLRRKAPGESVRLWSAGCASGEEAYTLAMCAAELLEPDALRDLKIYATDIDEGALVAARAGTYSAAGVQHVTPERLERFFEELPHGGYRIRRDLRSMVIFGRHNVLQDPPISRLDVLCCRNLLIYFDTKTQQELLGRFHYALRSDGFLFLGKAETLMTRSTLFRPAEPRFRIFHRVVAPGVSLPVSTVEPRRPVREARDLPQMPQNYMLQSLINLAPEPLILLDVTGRFLMASARAREVFQVTQMLLGRNFLELEERFRPLPLRLAIEEVVTTGRPVRIDEVEVPALDGTFHHLSLEVQPILDPWGALNRILVWAHDISRERHMTVELTQVRQDLATLSEELQCTNEELETANEELQCTNEELETTNEELQSTNEELETTIEELQSTNEELETANEELRSRQDELNTFSRYQEMVLSGLKMGLIVLDRRLTITSWNKTSEETWGLRETEAVGQELFGLDSGLPSARLREPLEQLLKGQSGQESLVLDATNRRGRRVRCDIRLHPLMDAGDQVAGAIILIEEQHEPARPEQAS